MSEATGPFRHCVLAVDVGNTGTEFGLFAAGSSATDAPLATWEVSTPAHLTADEARLQVSQVLGALADDLAGDGGLPPDRAAVLAGPPLGAVLSCVVPSLVEPWRRGLARACGTRALVVGPGLRTGMRLRYNDPAEVGPDRIASALAARESYGAPVVVVDFGTTLSIEVVDAEGAFAGGVIAPGLALGAEALSQAAARLPVIELAAPPSAIGRSTCEAMQSGVVFGEVVRVDGLLARVFGELGGQVPVVLTGGSAAALAGLLGHEAHVDTTLTLRGLHQLWLSNPRTRR